MAQFYTIKCPKCGYEFNIVKGVFMSWDISKPIPKELKEETPFSCPNCNYTMCVQYDHFEEYVINVLFGD